MRKLIADLSGYRSGVVCQGLDDTTRLLCRVLPFTVHTFDSGAESNGWIVPQKWTAHKAVFRSETGRKSLDGVIPDVHYDGNRHPLGVAAYSQPFQGSIRGADLKKHLFYSDRFDDALIYHTDLWYKPHVKDWGFCVSKRLFDQVLDSAMYQVDLQTTFEPGTMKVCEYVLPGRSKESILLCAHNCHPGLANDDLSGVAIGIEVMKRLALIPDRRFTYRLLVAPEHYGSIFYLDRFGRNDIAFALFLESLGTKGQFTLQRSFLGDTRIDRALKVALPQGSVHVPFRESWGNDETVFEGAGYDIPCPSLSRGWFDEYHTSRDTPDIMHAEKLEEAVVVVLATLSALDQDVTMERKFTGLVCLGNPKYDLYQPFWDPSIAGRKAIDDNAKNWNRLMNCLPRYFDGETTCLDIAERFGLPFQAVRDYVQKFADKGLVELDPADLNGTRKVLPPR